MFPDLYKSRTIGILNRCDRRENKKNGGHLEFPEIFEYSNENKFGDVFWDGRHRGDILMSKFGGHFEIFQFSSYGDQIW